MIFASIVLALAAPFALAEQLSAITLNTDVTAFMHKETAPTGTATTRFFANIGAPGTATGIVVASPSKEKPNYFFHWARDAGLVMDVVNTMYAKGDRSLENKLWRYAHRRSELQKLNTQTGSGEPKFEANGAPFSGNWCRPQTDGPALTASTLIRFANTYIKHGGDMDEVRHKILPVVAKDLDYVATNMDRDDNCDLWEEVRASSHFYTAMVQRRAFQEAVGFFNQFNDDERARRYASRSWALGGKLDAHFSESRGHMVESIGITSVAFGIERRFLDAGTILAVIHTDRTSGGSIDQFSPIDDRVQATVPHFINSFKHIYGINGQSTNKAGQKIGLAIGRYAEDVYDGIDISQGNPWYLTTLAVAELYYRMVNHYKAKEAVVVTHRNAPFFNFIGVQASLSAGSTYSAGSHEFKAVMNALVERADEFVRRVQHHSDGGSLSEQYSRHNGFALGARDLTWSYASLITAAWQRDQI